MAKIDDFKKDLQALLKKYDASISFNVGDGSDTHGLYNERMEVEFYELREGARFKTHAQTEELAKGWGVDSSDL